jgi:hypothetical protein
MTFTGLAKGKHMFGIAKGSWGTACSQARARPLQVQCCVIRVLPCNNRVQARSTSRP